MAAHHLAQASPNAIAHHRASRRFLDAEAESALRQFVGAKENSEVGTRAALPGAIDGVKSAALDQPRLARKFQQPGFIRA
jgi:hypothetical protein